MKSLVAYTFPERQYKEILSSIKEHLDGLDVDYPPWPHISIGLVDQELSKEDRETIIKKGKEKPTFDIKGMISLFGKNSPNTYLGLKLNIPDEFREFHKWLTENYNVQTYSELKPHCSIIHVPKAQQAQLEERIPLLEKAAKTHLYSFKPSFISIWDNFQLTQISEDGCPPWLGKLHELIHR